MKQTYVTRQKTGKRSFAFFDVEGTKISDKTELDRLKKLAIPPAWQNVRIASSPRAKIQASGEDAAGRTQAIYHESYRRRQEKAKFERTIRFAHALPRLRRRISKDLNHKNPDKDKVTATVVRLMDEAHFRVGNDKYARDNASYGLTTLRSKHIEIDGADIQFDFIGKSGQRQQRTITDKRLSRIMRQLDAMPGYEVFTYIGDDGQRHRVKSADVNAYIKNVMGEEFSAKDFRTWAGTLLATAELAIADHETNLTGRKKAVTACIKSVAKRLGNTPAVTRSSYVDPRVIEHYMSGVDFSDIKPGGSSASAIPASGLTSDEVCVLHLLSDATPLRAE